MEGHAPSWPSAQVITDATAARPSITYIWLRLLAGLGCSLVDVIYPASAGGYTTLLNSPVGLCHAVCQEIRVAERRRFMGRT